MSANKEREVPVRIIYKKKGHGHGHHGGAWKVAFADFMTAMFAMFLVLWLINQSSDVKSAVAGYFQDPLGRSDEFGSSIVPGEGAQASRQVVVQDQVPPAENLLRQEIAQRITLLAQQNQMAPDKMVKVLQERFALGLTPIREALMRLAVDGLVQGESQRGFRACGVSAEEWSDLMSARRELERSCLARAIERGDAVWEARIESTMQLLARTPLRSRVGRSLISRPASVLATAKSCRAWRVIQYSGSLPNQ